MSSDTQVGRLFDRKFLSDTLRNLWRCPKCRSEYSHTYTKNSGDTHARSNRPFLISCGHSLCENCLHHRGQNLVCCVCLRPVDVTGNIRAPNAFTGRNYFDLNFYLYGAVNQIRYFRGCNNSSNNKAHPSICPPPREEPVYKCKECDIAPAFGKCPQCKVLYCRRCFDTIHTNSKVLMRHKLYKLATQADNSIESRLQTPLAKKCHIHKRPQNRYCQICQLVCCSVCAKTDHIAHPCYYLKAENDHRKDDFNGLLENVKKSRDSIMKAIKDVKLVEAQMEDFAKQTLEDISTYFLLLHSLLQNEERRVIEKFLNFSAAPESKINDSLSKLRENQNLLTAMNSRVHAYKKCAPIDIPISDIIDCYNTQLEELHCQVQISKLKSNPFIFERTIELRNIDFSKWHRYAYKDPELTIRLGPIYGDFKRCFQTAGSLNDQSSLDTSDQNTLDSEMKYSKPQTELYKMSNPLNNESFSSSSHFDNTSTNPSVSENIIQSATTDVLPAGIQLPQQLRDNATVYISYFSSPDSFYVKSDEFSQKIQELSKKYVNYIQGEHVPLTIKEGNFYMAYYVAGKQWYRGIVKKILPNDLYQIFLVDVGEHLELSKTCLASITDKDFRSMPYAAIHCALHNLVPTDSTWTEEANNAFIAITHNHPLRVSVYKQIEDVWSVDLTTMDGNGGLSIRDAFLYTGLARERSGVPTIQLEWKMAPIARINQQLQKPRLQPGDMLTVKVTHIEDPLEFFVIPIDKISERQTLIEDLNSRYESAASPSPMTIFLGAIHMCCAAYIGDVWHRASIEEIMDEGKVRIRLVDTGNQEIVYWRHLFVLESSFKPNEFAIKCALADILPLQKNNYAWTEEAIDEFKSLTSNPTLQMMISSTKEGGYKVVLHVAKKSIDVNIGAVLVKYGHGMSTGEATQLPEFAKIPKMRLNLSNTIFDNGPKSVTCKAVSKSKKKDAEHKSADTTNKTPAIRVLKRTLVTVTHIISPGEFFLQLMNLCTGITNFHQQIQRAMKNVMKSNRHTYREWFVGDHCFVYTDLKHCIAGNLETIRPPESKVASVFDGAWYRGIVVSMAFDKSDLPYVVFLRDIGATVRDIGAFQLHPIEQRWDRVANSAHRCHLACVVPTGGMQTWSHSAIDCFKHSIKSFPTLSVTLQSKPTQVSNSLPIVLWGTTTETSDPLAPSILKHSNINRILVKAGLAHLVERLDVTQQMDEFVQMVRAEGEISLEDWFKDFSDNAFLKAIERSTSSAEDQSFDDILEKFNEPNIDVDVCYNLDEPEITETLYPPPEAWLKTKDIKKTIFTGYISYVDLECILYLHDAEDAPFLKKMSANIKNLYGETELPDAQRVTYCPGQACIAKYYRDNKFYRGIVRKINAKNEYDVYFIDYGNVESVPFEDLRPFAPYPHVLAFASKFRIGGICPKNGAVAYKPSVLDVIHFNIVDKMCNVRVQEEEWSKPIKNCDIRMTNIDMSSFLIKGDHVDAEKGSQQFHKNPVMNTDLLGLTQKPRRHCFDSSEKDNMESILHQGNKLFKEYTADTSEASSDVAMNILGRPEDDNSNMDTDVSSDKPEHQQSSLAPPPPNKKRMYEPHEYIQMLQMKLNEGSLTKSINKEQYCDSLGIGENENNDDDEGEDFGANAALFMDDDDQDIVELEHSFALNYWHSVGDSDNEQFYRKLIGRQDDEGSFYTEKFLPNDSSTAISHFSGIENFKPPQLLGGIKSFCCTMVSIVTPTLFQIFPNLPEFKCREVELQRRIQFLAKSSPVLTEYEPQTICLALYSKDRKWYRALIRSYNPRAKQANVLYVDYLNSEHVPNENLKQCPLELIGWPLRTVRVLLHGLKPNPDKRTNDVLAALRKIVKKHPLLEARVKKEANTKLGAEKGMRETTDNLMAIELHRINEDDSSAADATSIFESLVENQFYICS